jgi:hypothetical protein
VLTPKVFSQSSRLPQAILLTVCRSSAGSIIFIAQSQEAHSYREYSHLDQDRRGEAVGRGRLAGKTLRRPNAAPEADHIISLRGGLRVLWGQSRDVLVWLASNVSTRMRLKVGVCVMAKNGIGYRYVPPVDPSRRESRDAAPT